MFLTVNKSNTVFPEFRNFFDDVDLDLFRNSELSKDFKVNSIEYDKDYSVEAFLPGIDKSDISVSIIDNILSISYNINKKAENKDEKYLISEEIHSNGKRLIHFSKDIDIDNITSEYVNGKLTIKLPKVEKVSKTITL